MKIEEFYKSQIKSLKKDNYDYAAQGIAGLLDIKIILENETDNKVCIEKISNVFEELGLMINTPFYLDGK